MLRRAGAPLLALLLLLPSAVAAQQLRDFTERLTLAWARNDASSIASFIAERGVSLNVDGDPIGPVLARQAAAVLRQMFGNSETVSVTLTSRKEFPGRPARAYLELVWECRSRGTTIPDRRTVFLAVVRQDSEWRITEIRLIQ